jgi:SprT-like family
MEITRALAVGRRLLREHGLDDWTIVADRAKTRAGVCRFAKRQIGISAPITTLHDESEVLDTILHEIAHALVGPQHGHDSVWRAKALELGCTGERCVSSDAPRVPGDWVGRCPAGHEKSRHRAPTRLMSCGQCARRFDSRHLFTWTYRGRPAALPASYAAQLAALRLTHTMASESARPTPMVGDLVEVASAGPWRGLAGEVELVGAVRCQVRVGDDLVSLPLDAVRVLPASAARWSDSLA